MATLSPGLSCNHPLNTWSPKTNPKCSSKCMLQMYSFKDLLSHQAFLSLPPAWLQILHSHLLHPSLSFMPCKPLNPASLLPTPDPEAEHLSHDCVQTLDMTLNPFEHITDQSLTDPKVPSSFIDGSAPKPSPIWVYSSGTARQSYPPLPHQVSHTPSSHILTTGWIDSSYISFDPSKRPKDKHLHWIQTCL